jgi:hypothetical protein
MLRKIIYTTTDSQFDFDAPMDVVAAVSRIEKAGFHVTIAVDAKEQVCSLPPEFQTLMFRLQTEVPTVEGLQERMVELANMFRERVL